MVLQLSRNPENLEALLNNEAPDADMNTDKVAVKCRLELGRGCSASMRS